MNFSKRLNLFGDEIFAALNERRLELEKQGKKIYNMSVGTPDFHTPDHIKKALMEAAADDQNWLKCRIMQMAKDKIKVVREMSDTDSFEQ